MVRLKSRRDMAAEISDDEASAMEAPPKKKKAAGGKRKRGNTSEDDYLAGDEESVPTKKTQGKKGAKRKIEPLLFKRGVSTTLQFASCHSS